MMYLLNNKDRVGSLLILVFAIVYLKYALGLPLDPTAGDDSFNARTLPVGLSIAAIAFAFLELIVSTRRAGDGRINAAVQGFSWLPTLLLVLSMAVYAFVFDWLGFILASYLFLHSGFLILGERRLLLSATVALALVMFLWSMLTQAFGIYLDSGDLFRFFAGLSN